MNKRVFGFICPATLLVFSASFASAQDFTPVETYAVGTNPVAMATGDFDKDGFLDIAIADWNSNDVSVLINKGNGNAKFKDAKIYSVGTNPHAVAVGDFNGDTYLDIAVANVGGGITILLNDGVANPGHFKKKNITDTDGGDWPYAVAVADFDGDTKMDLAVVNQYEGVSILLGVGDGTFGAPMFIPLAGGHTASLVAGLIDGDAKTDLAVVDSSGPVYFLKGKATAPFLQPGVVVATLPRPFGIIMDTIDGNNKPDLVITDYSSNVYVLLNQGSATFTSTPYAVGFVPTSVATGDFNFDGKKDLVVTNSYTGTITVWHGAGAGTFSVPQDTPTGILSDFVVAGDFKNNGHAEVAVALYLFNQVAVLKGQ